MSTFKWRRKYMSMECRTGLDQDHQYCEKDFCLCNCHDEKETPRD